MAPRLKDVLEQVPDIDVIFNEQNTHEWLVL